jgi:hypothetical protein
LKTASVREPPAGADRRNHCRPQDSMQLAGGDGGGEPFAEDFGLGADAVEVAVEAVAVAVGAGRGLAHDDRFAAFADLVEGGLLDDLGRTLGPRGEGFVIRHDLVIKPFNWSFCRE